MSIHDLLVDFIVFLGVTITLVPLFRSIKISPILSYLVGGIIVGPWGLGLITNITSIFELADLGIILLLFVIGLEMSPRRLSLLRKKIFIDGGIQMLVSTIVFMIVCNYFELSIKQSIVVSIALSLSSTAFVLEYLKDSKQLTLSHGQMSFSILLFQDIIIIPLLTVLPFLAPTSPEDIGLSFSDLAVRALSLIGIIFLGRYLLRPAVGWIKKNQPQEIFTAACLFLIMSMALLVDEIGLSKPLGAFLAGIFLSDSDFHVEVEKVIHPIKGMLIGIFFMAFGIGFNLDYFMDNWQTVLLLSLAYIFLKFLILAPLGHFILKNSYSGIKLGLLLCQGGEFGLVIISAAYTLDIIPNELSILLVSLFTSSLLVAPILAKVSESVKGPHHENEDPER